MFTCDFYVCWSPYGSSVYMCNMHVDTCEVSVYIHMHAKQLAVVFAEHTVSMKYFTLYSTHQTFLLWSAYLKYFRASWYRIRPNARVIS